VPELAVLDRDAVLAAVAPAEAIARVRDAFLRHHSELLTPDFWQECQRRVAQGEVVDFFPYPESMRFAARRPAPSGPPPVEVGRASA
jgi:hypothetical protein